MRQLDAIPQRDPNRQGQILAAAKRMIADIGFDGVSMRDLAAALGVTPAALYHYFPTKQSLLLAVVATAPTGTPNRAMDFLQGEDGTAEERLFRFVRRLCERFVEDPDFLYLIERALLDREPEIRKALNEALFSDNLQAMEDFLADHASGCDKHMLAISVFGLVNHHYKTSTMRQALPGYDPKHDEPEYVARHVMKVLRGDIFGGAGGREG